MEGSGRLVLRGREVGLYEVFSRWWGRFFRWCSD